MKKIYGGLEAISLEISDFTDDELTVIVNKLIDAYKKEKEKPSLDDDSFVCTTLNDCDENYDCYNGLIESDTFLERIGLNDNEIYCVHNDDVEIQDYDLFEDFTSILKNKVGF